MLINFSLNDLGQSVFNQLHLVQFMTMDLTDPLHSRYLVKTWKISQISYGVFTVFTNLNGGYYLLLQSTKEVMTEARQVCLDLSTPEKRVYLVSFETDEEWSDVVRPFVEATSECFP